MDDLRRMVEAKAVVEGFHRWPEAPDRYEFLRHRHRHLFVVRVRVAVGHGDREVEFVELARDVRRHLEGKYGAPAEFGARSCEAIAEEVLREFGAEEVWVHEDDENGGGVRR